MNCANHIDRSATGFCQNCGKPLCPECMRSADGLILCEPCQTARHAAQSSAAGAAWGASSFGPGVSGAPGTAGPGAYGAATGATNPSGQAWAPVPGAGFVPGAPPYGTPVYPPMRSSGHASPVIAGLLGFIPGVGAMYNGQFVKALLHVVIFILLIGASEHFALAGMLIAAWVFYQVFDAAQTAAARRDGRPVPDPFGILDLSTRLGPQAPPPGYASGYVPTAYPPTAANSEGTTPVGAQTAGSQPVGSQPYGEHRWEAYVSPQHGASAAAAAAASASFAGSASSASAQYAPGAGPVPPDTPPPIPPYAQPQVAYTAPYPVVPPASSSRGEPVGAIVLIVVGLLFLLSTLGWLNFDWIGRGWPLLLLLAGVWLLIRRARSAKAAAAVAPAQAYYAPQPPQPSGGAPPEPTSTILHNPLSITPAAPFSGQTESEEDRR
jgi:hypothetical protein